MISGDEDRKMIHFPLIKSTKKLGYEFHIYQKHEMGISNFSIFKQGKHPTLNSR